MLETFIYLYINVMLRLRKAEKADKMNTLENKTFAQMGVKKVVGVAKVGDIRKKGLFQASKIKFIEFNEAEQ